LIKNEPPNSSDLRKVENPQISATSSLELTKDSFNLTDSRSSRPLPEVEIVSLLEEELPRYQLRADYLTEIGGCRQNYDFVIQTPVLEAQRGREVIEGLTSDQAEATLDYFVSCGDRLSQMTKTYHDVEAVTRLLQEKENDLELAAKIGQELLERNRRQDERVNGLEIQLASSSELITQLRHELIVKTDLLHVYTNDAIEEDISPIQDVRNVHDEIMQRKVYELEDENKRLHQEATEVRTKPITYCAAKHDILPFFDNRIWGQKLL
jgi:trafficking kinesin-binding protein 1